MLRKVGFPFTSFYRRCHEHTFFRFLSFQSFFFLPNWLGFGETFIRRTWLSSRRVQSTTNYQSFVHPLDRDPQQRIQGGKEINVTVCTGMDLLQLTISHIPGGVAKPTELPIGAERERKYSTNDNTGCSLLPARSRPSNFLAGPNDCGTVHLFFRLLEPWRLAVRGE
jgi:hypothetical protein